MRNYFNQEQYKLFFFFLCFTLVCKQGFSGIPCHSVLTAGPTYHWKVCQMKTKLICLTKFLCSYNQESQAYWLTLSVTTVVFRKPDSQTYLQQILLHAAVFSPPFFFTHDLTNQISLMEHQSSQLINENKNTKQSSKIKIIYFPLARNTPHRN